MNKILPDINMLEPIVDSRETYCDSPMIKDFEKLSDIDRLQVLADIVRQTMIYEEYPNPITEIDSLIGDDYTSSKVFLTYLQSLNIYTDSYIALVTNRKSIDLEKYNGYHFVVIVRDINKNEYVVDTTPDIGYSYGEVNKLVSNSIYNDYLRIDEELDCFFKFIRYDMYNISNHHYDLKQIEDYINENTKVTKDFSVYYNKQELANNFKHIGPYKLALPITKVRDISFKKESIFSISFFIIVSPSNFHLISHLLHR